MTPALLLALLALPTQTVVTDPPCGTIVTDDETEVDYTADLDCSTSAFALQINAADVTVDGGSHTITAGQAGIVADGADGIDVLDLTLSGASASVGLDVSNSDIVVISNLTASGFLSAGVRVAAGSGDVTLVDSALSGAATCALLSNVSGDNSVDTSTFAQCADAGLDVSAAAGATLEASDNAFASTLVVGSAIRVANLTGTDTFSGNRINGFGIDWELNGDTDLVIDAGNLCGGGGIGASLVGSTGTTIDNGSFSAFSTAILIDAASAGTTLTLAFSDNGTDVVGTATRVDGTLADTDGDGLFDVCDTANAGSVGSALVDVIQLGAGDAHCPAGGVEIDSGVDIDGSGTLEQSEITSQGFVCDGNNGNDGQNGTNGNNGANGTNGSNGTDGTNGKNGADGKDGANGKNGTDGFVDKNGDGVDDRIALGGGSANCSSSGTPAPFAIALLGLAIARRRSFRQVRK